MPTHCYWVEYWKITMNGWQIMENTAYLKFQDITILRNITLIIEDSVYCIHDKEWIIDLNLEDSDKVIITSGHFVIQAW